MKISLGGWWMVAAVFLPCVPSWSSAITDWDADFFSLVNYDQHAGAATPSTGDDPERKIDPSLFSATPEKDIPEEERALTAAVKALGAKSADGKHTPFLCKMTRSFNEWMSRTRTVDHVGFDQRTKQIFSAGGRSASEILAYFQPAKATLAEDAAQCANQWKNSPGHREAMFQAWDNYCYSLLKTSDGRVYCSGLFAKGLPAGKAPEKDPEKKEEERKEPKGEERKLGDGESAPRGRGPASTPQGDALRSIPGYQSIKKGPNAMFGKSAGLDFDKLWIHEETGALTMGDAESPVPEETKRELIRFYQAQVHKLSGEGRAAVRKFLEVNNALPGDRLPDAEKKKTPPTPPVPPVPPGPPVPPVPPDSQKDKGPQPPPPPVPPGPDEKDPPPVPPKGGDPTFAKIQWVAVKKFRDASADRYGETGADIIAHARQPDQMGDAMTNAHETVHGMNSDLRNGNSKGGMRVNGFYVGNGKGIVLQEPKVRLSHIAENISGPFRKRSRFNTYLVSQRGAWDDRALYILDEFVAYNAGAKTAVDLQKRGLYKGGGRDGVAGTMDFVPFVLGLAVAIEKYDPDYLKREPQFQDAIQYMIQDGMKAFLEGRTMPPFKGFGQDELYDALRTSPDGQKLRDVATRWYGEAWCKKWLGF